MSGATSFQDAVNNMKSSICIRANIFSRWYWNYFKSGQCYQFLINPVAQRLPMKTLWLS